MASKFRIRRLLVSAIFLVLTLVVLAALVPTFINLGLGRGMIERAAGANLNGTVTIDDLKVRWFGPQNVRGFNVHDEDGTRLATLNIAASPSLFAIMRNRLSPMVVDIDGEARGTIEEDGSISLAKLFATDSRERSNDNGPRDSHKPRSPDRPLISLENVPGMHLRLGGLTIELDDAASGETLTLRDLHGELLYQPGSPLIYSLEGTTHALDTDGRLVLSGNAEHLFSPSGRFTPRGAVFVLTSELQSIPVPGSSPAATLQHLDITLHADDLGRELDVLVRGRASIEGEPDESTLIATLKVNELFNAAGALQFAMENLAGTAGGSRVPIRLVQPFVADTAFNLPRDFGPTADFNVEFTAGDVIEASLLVHGSRANVRMTAAYDAATGAWDGEEFVATTPNAHPDLVEALTGFRIADATDLHLTLDRFRLPALDPETNRRPLTDYLLHGRLSFDGPARLHLTEDRSDEPISIAGADLQF
ncbi:MAG: hypothetical protein EA377_11120, partial [Phycisphaerales bacterium]